MNRIPLADARQNLPELIDKVERGEKVVITRNGRPIVELVSCTKTVAPNVDEMSEEEWAEAHRRMMALVEEGVHLGGLKIDREELYGRGNMQIIA